VKQRNIFFCLQFIYGKVEIVLGIFMEDIPSMWVPILSWFTPIILFLSLNVVIGTIIVTFGM
jgi:hypothetical protein